MPPPPLPATPPCPLPPLPAYPCLQLLGLQEVQLPLEAVIKRAYDELMDAPLEEGYRWAMEEMDETGVGDGGACSGSVPSKHAFPLLPSCTQIPCIAAACCPWVCSQLARLGKEKLLYASLESLRGVRGRTSLLRPAVQVEPLLLPGAMALLHQVSCRAGDGGGGGWRVRGRFCRCRSTGVLQIGAQPAAPVPVSVPLPTHPPPAGAAARTAACPPPHRPPPPAPHSRSCGSTTSSSR